MPSVRHQVLVELFRNCGALAPELLRTCANLAIAHDRVDLRPSDLSQVVSAEYRADAVVELRDGRGTVVAAVIVEVQLRRDPDKRLSWPVYLAALRAELACPVFLLVLTEARAIARWARRPIELGHPGFCLTPMVVCFDELPRIVDLVDAHRLPELAVLSAMAHPDIDVAATAIDAIAPLPGDRNQLYLDVIMAALPPETRQRLETRMEGYKYQSEFARKYYNQGLRKGRIKGREEGREHGLADGLRRAVLALARDKLKALTDHDDATIAALRDEAILTRLIGALGKARGAHKVRHLIDAALAEQRGA